MNPTQALTELSRLGLRPVLEAALLRYRRDGQLGRSRPELPAAAWDALARLTGQTSSNHSGRTLNLALLDEVLRRSRYGLGLPQLLEALHGGPIRVRQHVRQHTQLAWDVLLDTVTPPEWQTALRRGEAGASLLRPALYEPDLAARVALVGQALLSHQERPERLPVLAARLTGNAHAFDVGEAAGRLLRAALSGLELEEPPRDGVSSFVLTANLRGPDWLSAAVGHSLLLPWREVARFDTLSVTARQLWVVENPSVFEALHEAFPLAPLLCTQGQPSAAAVLALSRLEPGTRLHLSCDLDFGGLSIAAFLRRRVAADWQLWRMDAASHALACSRGFTALKGDLAPYAADFPELVAVMQASGQGAHQENLLPELVADVDAAWKPGET